MPRILVADDNTNIQKMVSLALQQRGVEVTSVSNGEAAVRRLPDLNPDLILADIFMPVRNGYELCEWVKNDPKYSHIPVILLVGAFDPLDEKEARRVGADGVLKKPFIPPDPLIAMVTSTLEKNPRIAAEMAAAIEAPAPPPPAPVAQKAPKVIEVKPEPEPESSAASDDASLAYGFGAGRRGLDDDEPEESAAARAPKSNFEKDGEGEDSEQTSTAHDWRRSAMSFEVPEEDSNRPAFATEEADSAWTPDTGATSSHIEPPRFGQEAEASATEIEPSKGSTARSSAPWLISQHQPVIEAQPVSPDEFPIEEPAAHVPANESLPEPAALMPEPAETSPSAAEPEPAQPAAANSFGSSPAAAVEPSFASKASHWMDLMGSQVEKPQSDWLSSISARATEKVREAERNNLAPVDETKQPGAPQEHAERTAASSPVPKESSQPESPSEDDWFFADEPEAAGAPAESPALAGETAEEPVGEHTKEVAEEVEAVLAEASEPVHVEWPAAQEHERAHEPTHEPVNDPVHEIEATVAEPLPLRTPALEPAFVSDESSAESSDKLKLSHDPELVEDMGVQVTPEPLLLDESPRKSSNYGSQQEEVSPAFTFLPNLKKESSADAASLAPKAEESVPSEPAEQSFLQHKEDRRRSWLEPATELVPAPEPEPVVKQPVVDQHVSEASSVFTKQTSEPVDGHVPDTSPVLPEHVSAPYEERSDSALEFSSFESAERASTSPPPTREDLAGIPFLNPPPGFDDEPEKESEAFDSSADSAVVEDVVDRVLAKIEPQLRDLLSQNLKPLLENLVQNEMQKKDR